MYKYLLQLLTMLIILNQTASLCVAAPLSTNLFPPSVGQLWDAQNFDSFKNGEILLPDTLVSESLSNQLNSDSDIKEIKFTALDGNRIRIELATKQYKKISLEGTIEEFHHDKQSSHFKFKILKKSVSDRPLTAWLFSRLSLSLLTHLFGSFDAPDGLNVSIKRNTVSVDFHEFLATNVQNLGQIGSIPITEVVRIHGITSSAGFIHVRTSLDVNSGIDYYLKSVF